MEVEVLWVRPGGEPVSWELVASLWYLFLVDWQCGHLHILKGNLLVLTLTVLTRCIVRFLAQENYNDVFQTDEFPPSNLNLRPLRIQA